MWLSVHCLQQKPQPLVKQQTRILSQEYDYEGHDFE